MTTALYRRYRPETFDEVIGQDHVTEPLKAALRSNRVTHAYLFSGPRGCGKTTSARILARCLNCAEGPTDTPCGTCDSCRDLATGGPGSLDVVEIDAASHNGVDDARELRERATFAPARDRYKVFILDEAHMVTPQGFNALLKLVEEPPEHVKFVFATTEPERVIGTIRSRTHHYPFRLVPGETMVPFLQDLCEHESITVGEGVLPLVVRAGGGSVRDSLSVLDQLMAGSIDSRIDYSHAIALLGYTDAALLDDSIESLGEHDGAHIFATIERMVESGHDPRRFVEDLLQRLRDLLIVAVAGEQARDILGEIPHDQLERMFAQARLWGPKALSQAAELTDEALRQMVGATSPRLQLELLVGRILIETQQDDASKQGAAQADAESTPVILGDDGKPLTGAALAREELRRVREAQSRKAETSAQAVIPEKAAPAKSAADAVIDPRGSDEQLESEQSATERPRAEQSATVQPASDEPAVVESKPAVPTERETPETQTPQPVAEQAPEDPEPAVERPVAPAQSQREQATSAHVSAPQTDVTANLHGKWDQFIDAVNQLRRATRFLLAEHAKIVSEDAESVTFSFVSENLRNAFYAGGHDQVAVEAIRIVIGSAKQVHTTVGDAPVAQDNSTASQEPPSQNPRGQQAPRPQATGGARGSQIKPSQEQSAEPEPPADDGWGPVAVPGAGLAQNLDAQPQSSAPTNNPPTPLPPQAQSQPTQNTPAENTADQQVSGSSDTAPMAFAEPGFGDTEVAGDPDDPQYAPASPDEAAEELAQNIANEAPPAPPVSLSEAEEPTDFEDPTGGARADDPAVQETTVLGLPVVQQIFGATLIEEIDEGSD